MASNQLHVNSVSPVAIAESTEHQHSRLRMVLAQSPMPAVVSVSSVAASLLFHLRHLPAAVELTTGRWRCLIVGWHWY
jgi:hypothetical protein